MSIKDGASRPQALSALSHGQRDRLAFIEFRLLFMGEVGRADVLTRFGIALSGVTRDFAYYRELAPGNMELDASTKTYRITKNFQPVFEHHPQRVLAAISRGLRDSVVGDHEPMLPCEFPVHLGLPSTGILAPVCRAIYTKQALRVRYHSMSSGVSERVLLPFALVDTGLRWHVRAFDRKSNEFRDFVLTRMETAEVVHAGDVLPHERPDRDLDWTRIIELDLIPHPRLKRPSIVEMDYGMQGGGMKVRVRAAVVGYMLLRWGVDASRDRHLDAEEVRLAIKDPLLLYGVDNAKLAPGYDSMEGTR